MRHSPPGRGRASPAARRSLADEDAEVRAKRKRGLARRAPCRPSSSKRSWCQSPHSSAVRWWPIRPTSARLGVDTSSNSRARASPPAQGAEGEGNLGAGRWARHAQSPVQEGPAPGAGPDGALWRGPSQSRCPPGAACQQRCSAKGSGAPVPRTRSRRRWSPHSAARFTTTSANRAATPRHDAQGCATPPSRGTCASCTAATAQRAPSTLVVSRETGSRWLRKGAWKSRNLSSACGDDGASWPTSLSGLRYAADRSVTRRSSGRVSPPYNVISERARASSRRATPECRSAQAAARRATRV